MNIYEDYKSYMKDKEFLLKGLNKEDELSVNFFIDDAVEILNYLANKAIDGVKLSNEEDEIFDIAYGYISNILEDLSHYYEDYFNKDIILFNSYKAIYAYDIMVEDLKGYLIGEDIFKGKNEERIKDIEDKIDNYLIRRNKITPSSLEELSLDLDIIMDEYKDYKPSYMIFNSIRQEMHI